MCNRHSFIVTRAGKVHHGFGITDSHTTIRELAGLDHTDSGTYAFEWQPPAGWPDADFNNGLTQDTAPIPHWGLKAKHLKAVETHLRRRYPTPDAWNAPEVMELPKNLKMTGYLDLRGTGITSLPDNLTVGGYLDLRGTGITSLPDNLTVGGWLDLRGTGITSLPDNLTVGGWLDLSDTGITSLPDNLTVGGSLYLDIGCFDTAVGARIALISKKV